MQFGLFNAFPRTRKSQVHTLGTELASVKALVEVLVCHLCVMTVVRW